MNNYEKYIRSFERLDYASLEGLPAIQIRNSDGVIDNDIVVTLLPVTAGKQQNK